MLVYRQTDDGLYMIHFHLYKSHCHRHAEYTLYLYCPQVDDLRLLETIISFINSKVHSENINYILLCLTDKSLVVFLLSGMCVERIYI
jgi:hypothetical protein